jgi:hypothetical protein
MQELCVATASMVFEIRPMARLLSSQARAGASGGRRVVIKLLALLETNLTVIDAAT